MSLPKSILKQVKGLELATRKIVSSSLAGEYKTHFKGQGMTFSEFREYVAGDDVRHISWPLTARAGKPYIKKFEEERELTLMLALDVSQSLLFGSSDNSKSWTAAQLSALLAFSASKNRDPVGLMLFSTEVEHIVLPGKSPGHVQRVLRDILYFRPQHKGTNLKFAFQQLRRFLKKKSVVFLVSDFFDTGFEKELKALAQIHDVVAVLVEDPWETSAAGDLGLVEVEDLESSEARLIDFASLKSKSANNQARVKFLRSCGADVLSLSTSEEVGTKLRQFLNQRKGIG